MCCGMETREITIARGLTRLKTIKAQIERNNLELEEAVVSSKRKSLLADVHLDTPLNHKEAAKRATADVQSNRDLAREFVGIKLAIARANLDTQITVGDRTFTIAEAMLLRREIDIIYRGMIQAYAKAKAAAECETEKYNAQLLANANLSEADKKTLFAEVIPLVRAEDMEELHAFVSTFMAEIDGTLNEVNALTKIVI